MRRRIIKSYGVASIASNAFSANFAVAKGEEYQWKWERAHSKAATIFWYVNVGFLLQENCRGGGGDSSALCIPL